jgi:uncharacterized protein (TIGR02466 family)
MFLYGINTIMIKTDLFPTPIWEAHIPDIDNSLLLDYAYSEYEKSGKQMRRYHSDTEQKKHTNWSSEDLNLDLFPELDKLYCELHSLAEDALQEFSPRESLRLFAGPTWFNINPKGTSVAPHQHPGCVLAGVYYIQANGNSANLRFMTPDRVTSWMYTPHYYATRTKYTSPLHTVTPANSKFVMFPGNLMHYVDSNEEEEDRVSIAFNFIQGF